VIILHSGAEQKPWTFPAGVLVKKGPLRTGDYSIEGLQDRVVVERKSTTDLVSTLVHDWLRFVKQLRRMAAMDVAVIAVEATPADIHDKKYMGDANPASVMGKCHAILLDYGVPVLFWGNREAAQREALHFLQLAAAKLGAKP
jgi:DNA excision repair protein ERCC-4